MNKTKLLQKLDTSLRAFEESFAGLSEAELLEPGVTGSWSVRDLIAHVTWWEEEALKHLPEILAGIRPQRYSVLYGGIDAFNAQMTELMTGASLAEVLAKHAETHRRLVETIRQAPEEQIATETRFRRRIRLDTYGHYPEHTEAIRSWRAGREEQA